MLKPLPNTSGTIQSNTKHQAFDYINHKVYNISDVEIQAVLIINTFGRLSLGYLFDVIYTPKDQARKSLIWKELKRCLLNYK